MELLKGPRPEADLKKAGQELQEGFPVFVAADNRGDLPGCLVCRVQDGVVWAESLFAVQAARRKGVGSLLYEKAEELAEKLGRDAVYNWVHPNNEKIIALKRLFSLTSLNCGGF